MFPRTPVPKYLEIRLKICRHICFVYQCLLPGVVSVSQGSTTAAEVLSEFLSEEPRAQHILGFNSQSAARGYVRNTLLVPVWFLCSEESADVLRGRLYNLVCCIWTLG